MKMKRFFRHIGRAGSILLLLSGCKKANINSAGPDWQKVKSGVAPVVKDSGYGRPYPLEINTLGWEDGQFISEDGLTLYCFYTPLDLFSFAFHGQADPFSLGPYMRGPFPEIVNHVPARYQKIAHQFLSSDIVISHRNSVSEPFPPWQIASFSTPATFDGAPQIIINPSDPDQVEFLVFTYLNPDPDYANGKNDIAYYHKTGRNPAGHFRLFPPPLNEVAYNEDNPHLEIIGKDSLVMFFTSEDRPGKGSVDIFFSRSNDNGQTWTPPEGVNFNTADFHDMPFLWKDDSGRYWMYYMNNDNNIARRKQMTPGDWKNWGEEIPVIEKGNALAVGEPTLTQWGDIVFGLVYDAGTQWGTSRTNRYDDDVWVLPKKGSPFDK